MTVRVSCSGAVLSSLLYEQLRNGCAQEGFMLGTIESHISEHISDSQICNEKMETTINVSSFLPCTMIGSFYSGAGDLKNEKLSGFLGSSVQNVIGWYRCRGSMCDDLYMREIMVHKQLTKMMTHAGGHFIIGILSCSPSEDNGTFTVCHKFMMQQQNNQFEGLPLQVINMGDTSTDEYRLKPRNPALYNSSAVSLVLSNVNNCEPGVSEAESLHNGLLQKLENLLPKFSNTQKDLEKALQEVTRLRMLCCNNGMSLDFTPEISNINDDLNLMDFEEDPSPTIIRKGKISPTKNSLKKKAVGRGKTVEEKVPADPFGFVHKEMEKLQVKGKGSPIKRMNRSRTNTPSPGRVLGKGSANINESPPARRLSESGGSNEGSPISLSKRSRSSNATLSQRDSQDDLTKGKSKAVRGLTRTLSKERNQNTRSTRSQSPALVNAKSNKSAKPKKREAWAEKSDSASQEF